MKSRNAHLSSLLLSLLTLANTQAVHAADETPVLDEVVVSGSRTETKLSDTPMSIGVVDEKSLKRDKPKLMGDAINRIAGVHWVDLGNEQHAMGIRQPNSTNAMYQYLEDGIPIRPLGVFNHNALNELNLAGAERVEVVKGASSSLYGSNAVGGAVNFITARPSLTPEATVGFRNEAVTGYQRVDTGASNTWDDVGMRFSHYSSRRSASNWQQYSNGNKDSLTLRGDYALSGSTLLHATVSHNNLDSATPGSLNPVDYQTSPGKSYQTFSWRKDKSTRLNVAWESETTQNGQTTVTLFGRENDHGQLPNYTISACTVSAACPTGYRGTINNNHVSSLGVDSKHQQEYSFLSSRLIGGVYLDLSPNTYKSNNLDVTRDATTLVYTGYTPNTTYATGTRDYKTDITNTALFAQWELTPLEKVRVVMGGRYDAINYNFVNYLTPGAAYGAANESRNFSHFSPKLGGTYTLGDDTNVFANASQGFTPPEVSQLYAKSAIPDLRPATYNSYELGLRMAFMERALKLNATLFRLDGTDTIVSYTIAPGNSENRNAGSTRSSGIELNLAYDAGMFDGRLGASFAKHEYLDYQASPTLDYSGKEMPAAPNTVTAEVGYKPVQGARIALEVVKQGSYWMNNANTVSYSGHTLLNMRGNYKMNKEWEAWLQGRNLTNQLYAESASSSYSGTGTYDPLRDQYTVGAPLSVMVGLTYTFDAKNR
ncbi:MAG: outer membrane receptor protein [Gallionellales bacterium 35-53-114]|jgi:outer membrane receptor protein involved in Fe transport|nr:MAG: outer membrane receptor protein [Gallionellales bacterium 35-53-114]OYZ64794.1 MAG: outer membrane receptor protein [Gallionellales bacterium 24-53-125]OZB07667.1 MAG: outer membrane receptor protein [Gallionellales bacterium 39-52-133]HQS58640.1 TonB-dependent receptor [Gallionellaceae bacterium]HQS74981.1 TonB-dependent receptor [Gallionellaceae bacterium]